jgi:hypothetical protein
MFFKFKGTGNQIRKGLFRMFKILIINAKTKKAINNKKIKINDLSLLLNLRFHFN